MLFNTSDYGVYVATRNNTGEVVYVGCSWTGIKDRLSNHKKRLKGNYHPNNGLQKLWNAKGLTFTHVVKCLPIKKLVLAFEKAYGAQYDFKKLVNSRPLGDEPPDRTGCIPWNKDKKCPQLSGENHPMYGKHHTEESIEKMKENHADFKGENNPFSGKKHTKESIEKMKENHPDYSGENNLKAKLTVKKVRMLKVMFKSDIKTIKQLSKLFNVSESNIYAIKSGRSWSDVKVPGWDC
jgi:hypothetical protein